MDDSRIFMPRPIQIIPKWFHMDDDPMEVSLTSRGLLLSNPRNWVRITKSSRHSDQWHVSWMIYHEKGGVSQGARLFTTEELKVAFALTNDVPTFIDRTPEDVRNKVFGERLTHCGCFVRFGRLLNIPGIGTRDDSDPNVSIDLEDCIKDAVQTLISR